jgi:hypothetical protein
MRLLATVGLVLAATTACTSSDDVAIGCTDIGSPSGIGIKIDPALVPKVDTGGFEACWAGDCRTYPIAFNNQAETFADTPGLPTSEVEVTVRLADRSGKEVLERTLTVTPVLTYPNGRSCEPDGARVLLLVGENGDVRAGVPAYASGR